LQQPTGFAKFLNIISGGILCKAKPAPPRSSSSSSSRSKTGERSGQSGSSSNSGDSARAPREQREPREHREPREPKPRREYAPVNPADIATERLYVGNLSYDASESDLFELFNGVGAVRNAEVVVNNRTQRSKGFAFVTMGSVDEARRAVQELNGKDFMGRPLQLSGAKPLGENDGRRDEDTSDRQGDS
jgi:RNA recognition motif-containing protein